QPAGNEFRNADDACTRPAAASGTRAPAQATEEGMMLHPALYYWLWTQQEDERIRELELRRITRDALKARAPERRDGSAKQPSPIQVGRLRQVSRFFQLRGRRRWSG